MINLRINESKGCRINAHFRISIGEISLASFARPVVGLLAFMLFLSFLPAFSQTKDWGVIDVSVCNMRTSPDYDAGMATQGVLGMPVQILEDGGWLKVSTPEGYEAYVHNRSVQPMTRTELSAWNTSKQVVVTVLWAGVYRQPDEKSQIVSDVVATNRLRLLGSKGNFYHVAFPDGRTGYLSKAKADELGHWRKSLNNSPAAILATAKRFVGIPYMWGGMSPKGMDCSGFVRTVLLCHDIIIPRDASQMATQGQHINIFPSFSDEGADAKPDFSHLQPGDLLFFGRKATSDKPAHVSHVGFYLGNGRFIHSLGMVQEASFNETDADYDAYDLGRLLWAQRVLPYINRVQGLFTTDKSPMYK